MAILLGPGFGRLLPMPLLAPWAWEATVAASLLFPIVGIVSDSRRSGRVHPAWVWGVAITIGYALATEAITYSPVGHALYQAVTVGSPAAGVSPLDFAPPPGAPISGHAATN